MASIKKRPNGTYQATIYAGRTDDGKLIREYITRDGYNECKRAAQEREVEIESRNAGSSEIRRIKVADWIEQWISLNENRLSSSTVRLYKLYLSAHYKPYFKKLTLGEIAGNEILLRKFMAKLLKTLSANTVCKIMTVLDKILREALRAKNPIQYIEMPKKSRFTPRVLSDDEFGQIREAIKGTRDEPFLLLAGWCGLRVGEICALEPSDILVGPGKIRVSKNMAINNDYKWETKPPKSDNGIRVVKAPEELMGLLLAIVRDSGELNGRLFKDYTPSSYSHRWARIVKEKSLPAIRFHDLRHYHASWLYSQGTPDQYAAKRLGHDIATLKSIYQHLGLDREDELDQEVADNLSKPPKVVKLKQPEQQKSS